VEQFAGDAARRLVRQPQERRRNVFEVANLTQRDGF
jgi:hypothetical protein